MISASLMKETAVSSGFFVIIFSPVGFQMWAESLTGDLIGAVLIRSEQKWHRIWRASPLLHHIQIKTGFLLKQKVNVWLQRRNTGVSAIRWAQILRPALTCSERAEDAASAGEDAALRAHSGQETGGRHTLLGFFFRWSTGLQAHQTPLLWFRGSGVCEKERNILYSWPGQLPAGGQPQVWKKKK